MISVSVKSDFKDVERALKGAQRDAIPNARRRTLNKLAQLAKSEAVRSIRARYRFKASVVRRAIVISRANFRALTAEVKAVGRNTPIIEFGARQTRKGVTVGVSKGKRKLLRSAFIATMKSGHTGVYWRKGKKRLPIQEVHTIGVTHALASIAVTAAMKKIINTKLRSTYDHELAFELKRRGL